MTTSIEVIEILAIPIFYKSVFNQIPPPIEQIFSVKFKSKNLNDCHKFILQKSQIPNHLPQYYNSQNRMSVSKIYSQIQKKDSINVKDTESQCLRYRKDTNQFQSKTHNTNKKVIKVRNDDNSELKISIQPIQQGIQDILNQSYQQYQNKKRCYGRHQICFDTTNIQPQSARPFLKRLSSSTTFGEANNSQLVKNQASFRITPQQLIRMHKEKLKRQQQFMDHPTNEYQYLNFILQNSLSTKRYRIFIKYILQFQEGKVYCGGFSACISGTLNSISKLNQNNNNYSIRILETQSTGRKDNKKQQLQFISLTHRQKITSIINNQQQLTNQISSSPPKIVRINQIDLGISRQGEEVNKSQCCLFKCLDR